MFVLVEVVERLVYLEKDKRQTLRMQTDKRQNEIKRKSLVPCKAVTVRSDSGHAMVRSKLRLSRGRGCQPKGMVCPPAMHAASPCPAALVRQHSWIGDGGWPP